MLLLKKKIVAAFRGIHVSPAKHSSASVTDGRTDRHTDRQTDGQTTDKVIPMCRYALQATQKYIVYLHNKQLTFGGGLGPLNPGYLGMLLLHILQRKENKIKD